MDIIIAQILGIIAFILFISSIQFKNKKKLLSFQLISNFIYGLQYLLLLVPTATFMNFISVFRCFIFYLYEKNNKKPPLYILIILLIIITLVSIITYNGLLSLIPIIIAIIYTVSTWQSNIKIIQIAFIFAACLWIVYNIKVGAYTSLIGNFFELISGTYAIIKYKKSKN